MENTARSDLVNLAVLLNETPLRQSVLTPNYFLAASMFYTLSYAFLCKVSLTPVPQCRLFVMLMFRNQVSGSRAG